MTSGFDVGAAAAALLAARRNGRPIPIPPEGPGSVENAIAVQAEVARSLGQPAGWKAGRGGTAAPFSGAHFGLSPHVRPLADFLRPALEVEVAFLLGRDLGCDGRVPDADEVRAAVRSVHAAIEIADSRFDTWPIPDPLWSLADHQSGGALIVDPNGIPWTGQPLGRAQVSLIVDGRSVFSGEGTNAGGEPIDLLVALAAHCAARGGLPAGTYVTTGSLTGMTLVEAEAEIEATVEGIGRVSLRLTT